MRLVSRIGSRALPAQSRAIASRMASILAPFVRLEEARLVGRTTSVTYPARPGSSSSPSSAAVSAAGSTEAASVST